MEKSIDKVRSTGLDIVRTIAILLVFLTHSLTYTVNFEINIHTFEWIVCVFLHFISIACVPLFLLLSGYLCRNKKLSGKYFFGIIPVVLSYIIIAAASVLLTNYGGRTAHNFAFGVRAIFDFSAIDYAWYVEMYIGLFLLIPFLNIMYNGLDSRKNKLVAIAVLICMTGIIPLFESLRPDGVTLRIIPDYWKSIYPVTYYLIGAFISEYRPKINKPLMLLITCISVFVPFVPCVLTSSVQTGYAWYVCNGFECITTAAIAVCIFLLFYDVDLPKVPSLIFKEISVCSFEMYLWSYCTDLWLYSKFAYSMPLMILTVLGITYILARITRICIYPVSRLIKKTKGKA